MKRPPSRTALISTKGKVRYLAAALRFLAGVLRLADVLACAALVGVLRLACAALAGFFLVVLEVPIMISSLHRSDVESRDVTRCRGRSQLRLLVQLFAGAPLMLRQALSTGDLVLQPR